MKKTNSKNGFRSKTISRIVWGKWFNLIIAVVCAFLLWLYVDVTIQPETRVAIHSIPVTFEGEEALNYRNLMLTEGKDATISLTVEGSRSVVSQLKRSNIIITVDLNQVTGSGNQSLDYSVAFPNSVSTSSVKIRERSSSVVNVSIAEIATKTVEIDGVFTGSVQEGYLYNAENFEFAFTEVTVRGRKSLVDKVDHAVATLEERDLNDTWSGDLPLTLVDSDGNLLDSTELTINASKVQTIFPVSYVKKVKLTVTLKDGGGATADEAEYSVSPKQISVSGTREVLDAMDSINLGTVDLSQIITSEKLSMNIKLPEDVTNTSGVDVADVTVKLSGLTTKKITTPDIRLTNVPEGMEATLVTESLDVRIRGPKESMSILEDDDVYVLVDLSSLEPDTTGNCTLPAEVKVRGISEVGAIDSYEVVISMDYAASESY